MTKQFGNLGVYSNAVHSRKLKGTISIGNASSNHWLSGDTVVFRGFFHWCAFTSPSTPKDDRWCRLAYNFQSRAPQKDHPSLCGASTLNPSTWDEPWNTDWFIGILISWLISTNGYIGGLGPGGLELIRDTPKNLKSLAALRGSMKESKPPQGPQTTTYTP